MFAESLMMPVNCRTRPALRQLLPLGSFPSRPIRYKGIGIVEGPKISQTPHLHPLAQRWRLTADELAQPIENIRFSRFTSGVFLALSHYRLSLMTVLRYCCNLGNL